MDYLETASACIFFSTSRVCVCVCVRVSVSVYSQCSVVRHWSWTVSFADKMVRVNEDRTSLHFCVACRNVNYQLLLRRRRRREKTERWSRVSTGHPEDKFSDSIVFEEGWCENEVSIVACQIFFKRQDRPFKVLLSSRTMARDASLFSHNLLPNSSLLAEISFKVGFVRDQTTILIDVRNFRKWKDWRWSQFFFLFTTTCKL